MRTCKADNCNNNVFGTDRDTGLGYCGSHQYLRTDKKKKNMQRALIRVARKVTGEGIFFNSLIASRPHISFISGLDIDFIDGTTNFKNCLHVLPKGQYPKFRLLDKNIVFGTFEEHILVDQGNEKQREAYSERIEAEYGLIVDWTKLKDLKEKLLKEYLHYQKI
jgi:hypothetical protein